MPKHLILTGGIYLDTILTVPEFPEEDAKQRASSLDIRFGGNCVNSIRALQSVFGEDDDVKIHLISCLPSKTSTATHDLIASFGDLRQKLSFESCIYREDHAQPASSYIIRSEQTGSRTIVNHNELPDMTLEEFEERLAAFATLDEPVWWHFEGRIPYTVQACIERLRSRAPQHRVSVEIEKPGRDGLLRLATMADCVFYSRSWAEYRRYRTPEDFLKNESTLGAYVTRGIANQPDKDLVNSIHSFNSFCTWGADGAASLDNRGQPILAREIPDPVKVVEYVTKCFMS